MKISELIQYLEHMQQEHGDLEVEILRTNCVRQPIATPCVDYKAIMYKWECTPRFASFYQDYEDDKPRKGEKVCRIY